MSSEEVRFLATPIKREGASGKHTWTSQVPKIMAQYPKTESISSILRGAGELVSS